MKKQRWNGQLVRTILNEHFTNTPIKRQPSSSTLDATSDGESSSLEGPSLEGPSLSGQPLPTAAMILTPTYIRRVGGVAVGLWIYDERGHPVDRMEKRRATTQPHHRPARSLVIEATSSSKKCGDDVRTILHPRIRHMHQGSFVRRRVRLSLERSGSPDERYG